MTEPTGMSCDELADMAAELALDVLTGRERADALAHLDWCDACREDIRQLTATGEALLGLLPASEPPPGFEIRVLERLGLIAPAPGLPRRESRAAARVAGTHRVRRLLAAAAAVVALTGAGLGGWSVRAATSSSASPATVPLTSAAVVAAASHQIIGRIYFYTRRPEWLYMAVNLSSLHQAVRCQVVSANGKVTAVGSFRLTAGYSAWGIPVPGSGPVAGARLVNADGTVLATASFTRH